MSDDGEIDDIEDVDRNRARDIQGHQEPIGIFDEDDEFLSSHVRVGVGRILHSMVPTAVMPLNTSIRCYPVSQMPGNGRPEIENGGKIILPPAILQHLTRMNITYPMFFILTNKANQKITHCGVLEFIAKMNTGYLPSWMMRNLALKDGDPVNIQSATLPVARFAKFEPQSVDFLDISNPKAMLENCLRNFACLTVGDIIAVTYNGKVYELKILETQPGPSVSIIECDMDVDFAPPVGYVEPKNSQQGMNRESLQDLPNETFVPFTGTGIRLDGKEITHGSVRSNPSFGARRRGIPDYDYVPGTLVFPRNFDYYKEKKAKQEQKENAGSSFTPFSGAGFSLRSTISKPSNP